jgi:hypothetical protein
MKEQHYDARRGLYFTYHDDPHEKQEAIPVKWSTGPTSDLTNN